MYSTLKEKISQYFFRILLFLTIFHLGVRPIQSELNKRIIAPILVEKLNALGPHFSLDSIKNHTIVYSSIEDNKKKVLSFSIPFGQFYFFLIFFLWFKPTHLIRALSIYNFILIPAYSFALFMFLRGHEIFGNIIIVNENTLRLVYFFIIFLKIFRPSRFNLIFSN